MAWMTRAAFAPHVGGTFRVHLDAARHVDVELVEVKPLGTARVATSPAAPTREPFALYFKGAADLRLPQLTYRVEHPQLGRCDIFMVAIGPGQGGMIYEAIFT
jgi:hypothetical protein